MYYLGIDLGGTNITAGIVEEDGKIFAKKSTPTMNGRQAVDILDDMAELCKKLMEEHGLTEKDIKSLGIGLPGLLDKKKGVAVYANNLNFDNINVVKEMNLPI